MKKSIFTHFNEAEQAVNTVSEFDELGAQAIICMLIDTVAAKNSTDPVQFAESIAKAVKDVNHDLGPYMIA